MIKDIKFFIIMLLLILIGNVAGGLVMIKYIEPNLEKTDMKQDKDVSINNVGDLQIHDVSLTYEKGIYKINITANFTDQYDRVRTLIFPELTLDEKKIYNVQPHCSAFIREVMMLISKRRIYPMLDRGYNQNIIEMVKRGETVCDVGSHMGYNCLPLSKAVGDKGKVYNTDIDPNSKSFIEWKLKVIDLITKQKFFREIPEREQIMITHPDNVICQTNTIESINLPENSFDCIIFSQVHNWARGEQSDYEKEFADSVLKALKDNGRIIILEKTDKNSAPYYIGNEKFTEKIRGFGFNIKKTWVDEKQNFWIVAEKKTEK